MAARQTKRFPAIILCGGKSTRMGRPKALVELGGRRLVERVAERIRPQATSLAVNANEPAITLPDALCFSDVIGGHKGPLAGIHAGLEQVALAVNGVSHVLFIPVDCPFLPVDLVERLAAGIQSVDTIVVAGSQGRIHPVIGLWPLSLATAIKDWLMAGKSLRMSDFLADKEVVDVIFEDFSTPVGAIDPFFNINRPEDLAFADQVLEALT